MPIYPLRMRVIEVRDFGGPERLELVERPVPTPGPGQAMVEHRAIGVNFVDLQHRSGTPYPMTVPFVPGTEAAGVVAALGDGVTEFAVGDRVAYVSMPGVYADAAVLAADELVPVPDGLSLDLAAASLMQGMTAHYLTHDAHRVAEGEWVLVHAAAGGVGRLAVAYARSLGASVVGTTSSERRRALIEAAGAVAMDVRSPALVDDVLAATGGVHAVYDSLGGPYFESNLRMLRARGDLVIYGLAAGAIEPFDPGRLSGFYDEDLHGSLGIRWTTLGDHTATPAALRARAGAVFSDVLTGLLPVRVAGTYGLPDAAEAHRAMAAGVNGKLLLVP
jgi:NADPH2:quinone reductase